MRFETCLPVATLYTYLLQALPLSIMLVNLSSPARRSVNPASGYRFNFLMGILFETPVSPKPARLKPCPTSSFRRAFGRAQPMRHAFPPSSRKTKSKRKALSLPTARQAWQRHCFLR